MARSSTSFQPGQSGNPTGRPKAPSARAALRAAFAKPDVMDATRSKLEAWAEDLVSQTDPEFRLNVLRFLEGNQPPQSDGATDGEHPVVRALRAIVGNPSAD